MAPLPWLLARPRTEIAPLLQRLEEVGLDARALPLLEKVPLPWTLEPAEHKPTICLVTSPFAARLVLAAHHRLAGVTLAALLPSTAAILEDAGWEPAIKARGGVEALAREVAAWAQQQQIRPRVLYPTSDAGMEQPEQTRAIEILAPYAEIQRAAIYETRPIPAEFPAPPYGIVLFSPSAVSAARAMGALPTAVVCVGASTARAWRAEPGALPCLESGPIEDLLPLLQRASP